MNVVLQNVYSGVWKLIQKNVTSFIPEMIELSSNLQLECKILGLWDFPAYVERHSDVLDQDLTPSWQKELFLVLSHIDKYCNHLSLGISDWYVCLQLEIYARKHLVILKSCGGSCKFVFVWILWKDDIYIYLRLAIEKKVPIF